MGAKGFKGGHASFAYFEALHHEIGLLNRRPLSVNFFTHVIFNQPAAPWFQDG